MKLVRSWIGLVLLVLGVFGILDAAGVAGFEVTAGRWWPVAIIGFGLAVLWSQRRLTFVPAVITVVGIALLAGQLQWTDKDLFWPAMLLVIGIAVLAGLRRRPASPRGESMVVFGGAKAVDRSAHLKHADVSAIFGGSTLDLRQAHIDDQATVDAFALFGGVDVLVPKDWRVELGGLPILGGYEDKTTGDGSLAPDAPLLKVNATAVFGGVKVANEPN
ncbi:LiaF transmembrane domain-containing protein [Amycolatopsis sp. NPDC004747]